MAWRPTDYLIEGELDNTKPGKVVGWMKFAGLRKKVTFDLQGDFHRDIRRTKILFKGAGLQAEADKAVNYLKGFAHHQTGSVGDMTAGLVPQDYVDYCYYVELNVMLSNAVFQYREAIFPSFYST